MEYDLKGKNVIVTGSTAGVGKACVELFAKEGCNVIVSGTKKHDDTDNLIDNLISLGIKAYFIKCDVGNEDDINNLFDQALEYLGSIDVIVNNAGIWLTSYVKDMELIDFKRTLDVNLIGPFLLSKRFVNYCIDNDRKGKIVNLTSQAAFNGSTSGHAHYASSKAGLVGFTISLAREVGPYGINVNAVAPGIIESKMVSAIVDDPIRREKYVEKIPLGKVSTPLDVAKVVLFLSSSQSDYMTGATLDVTGGMLMR